MEVLNFPLLGLIPLLPLLGALFNGIFGKFLPKKAVGTVATGVMLAAFGIAVYSVMTLAGTGVEDHGHNVYSPLHYKAFTWFSVGDFSVDFAFLLDPLSSILLLIITGVGTLIHLYSTGYMSEDPSFYRFFAYLNFFIFAMLCLVLGDNIMVLFFGWEGVGVASYLLIGFWFDDDAKAAAGMKAFITNRVGDLGVLVGLFLLIQLTGTVNFIEVREWASQISEAQLFADGQMTSFGWMLTVIAIAFFVGCTGKSAQIPLYVWLPDAMAGPTPVSALIHAATMVTAGVYFCARMSFFWAMVPSAMAVVAVIGALTAFFAATIGITQWDIKKVLAYSTVSQLGYMFLAVGVGSYFAAVFHLMTHAFFKALLFLGSGSVIHGMHHEQDIRKMGGLKEYMPVTHWTFLIGCIAIAGIPGFSGFFSKDEILWFAVTNQHALGGATMAAAFRWTLWGLGMATALMTAFYMFRLYFLTFHGKCRADEHTKAHIHESPWTMTLPLIVLAFLATFAGYLAVPHALGGPIGGPLDLHGWLHQVIGHGEALMHPVLAESPYAYILMAVAIFGASGSIFAAWKIYGGEEPIDLPEKVAAKLGPIYDLVYNKYYVDELYAATLGRAIKWSGTLIYRVSDQLLIDTLAVNGAGYATKTLGSVLRRFQDGDVQRYAAWVVFGIGILLLLVF